MIFTTTKEKSSCCDDESGCSTSPKAEHSCPSCKKYGLKINQITLKAQLKKEYFDKLKTQMDQFNFCSNPICDIVYYSNDNSKSYNQSQVKSKITIKNNDPKTPLCYCKKIF